MKKSARPALKWTTDLDKVEERLLEGVGPIPLSIFASISFNWKTQIASGCMSEAAVTEV
jgi:hypothetical protein